MLFEWLEVEKLCERPRFRDHSRETIDAFLATSHLIADRYFAPHNMKSDAHEPKLVDGTVSVIPEVAEALTAFNESGLLAATAGEDLGGVSLPHVVHKACFVWFQAANIATSAYPMLTMASANLLLAHGSGSQIDTFVGPMLRGRFFGTMCLSEPHAGSSLAEVSTNANLADDGSYRLHGNKMWISGGDHEMGENIVHLVLARTPGAPRGVKGLSLFLVPKYLVDLDGAVGDRNDVVVAGLNHKMGYRGTTNTLLNFGEGAFTPGGRPGAVGYLIGERGRGLSYMFHMMNEARIGVGLGAAALGYTSYLHALEYARVRVQGRELGSTDPTTPAVAIVRHPDVRRMLLDSKCYAEGSLAMVLYCARLLDEFETAESDAERQRAWTLLEILTPIAKSWPSQWCLVANSHAIQIHGGAGYTRDYPVEQFYRDNRLNMIHEGSHGIQALDLLGRKVTMNKGAGLEYLAVEMSLTASRATGQLAPYGESLQNACATLVACTEQLWASGDSRTALANASLYLEAAGHVVAAWMWLEQALAAGDHQGSFYEGKRAAARHFFVFELPKVGPQFEQLMQMDCSLLTLDDAVL